jgi:hypothetical protein
MRSGIFRVLRFQERLAVLHEKRLERVFAVNQRRHDLPRTRFRAMLENHNVAVANVLPNHRIARHAQRKGVPRWFEANGLNGDGNALARLLLAVAAETGWNRAEKRNFHDRCTADRLKGVREAKRTRLAVFRDKRPFPDESLNVAGSGVGACETEMPGNLTMGGTRPSRRQFRGDEIADGFLFFAQICHTAHLSSNRRDLSTK